MRVSLTVGVGILVAACSGGAEPSVVKVTRARGSGSGGADQAAPAQEKPGAPPGKPSSDDAPPPSAPPPSSSSSSSSSSTPPAPPPPAPTTTCTTPRCAAGGGLCGCKASNAAGDPIDLGCQDGQCACLVNGQVTSTFDAACDSPDAAAALLLAQCACN